MIKTTENHTTSDKTKNYPCLKKFNNRNLVVLFTEPKGGIVIIDDLSVFKQYSFQGGLAEDDFHLYIGSITIENN